MNPRVFLALLMSTAAAVTANCVRHAGAAELFIASSNKIGAYTTTGAPVNASLVSGTGAQFGLVAVGGDLFASSYPAVSEFDAATGAVVNSTLIPGELPSLTMWLAASGDDLYVMFKTGVVGEYTTSGATVNASLVTAEGPSGVAVSGGDLFVGNEGSISEYDATTGAAVNASLITGLTDTNYIAVSGGDLFLANPGAGTISEYMTSGTLLNASFISGLSHPGLMTVYGGDLFVVSTNGISSVSEYDATTGAPINTSLVTGLSNIGGIAVVPEPASWLMLALGAAALATWGAAGKRTRHK